MFARIAAAQPDRCLRTDALEVDGSMPGRIQGSEEAIRLLHQKRRLRMAARTDNDKSARAMRANTVLREVRIEGIGPPGRVVDLYK